jgi:LCP family protein required for cell wall assembly
MVLLVAKPSKKRGSPVLAKIALATGVVLMVLAASALVGVQTAIGKLESELQVIDRMGDGGTAETVPVDKRLDGAINLLLLGVDAREGNDPNDTNADTILIVHISASHDQAYLMSVPRDTRAKIPSNPATKFRGSTEKINAAFLHGAINGGGWAGGMGLQARAVSDLTGIDFNGAAVIDFNGFSGIIDALGSVNICVEKDTASLHFYHVDDKIEYVNEFKAVKRGLKPYVHRQGCRDMPGWEALDYSRIRKDLDDGDYGRQRHQQQLIKAMTKKAGSLGVLASVSKLEGLLSAVGKSIILDTDGVPLIDFLFSMKNLSSANIALLATNAGEFNSTPDWEELLTDQSRAMFTAAKQDSLDQFILENPEVLSKG